MTDPLTIPDSDHRYVWVFSVDLPEDELAAFGHEEHTNEGDVQWPLGDALGLSSYPDQDFVELFDLSTLQEYGFSRYLSEANGMDIGEDAAKLDALHGGVALVFSQALSGQERFAPKAPLSFVGRYALPVDLPTHEKLTSTSAEGLLPQGKPVKSDARIGGMVATFVLIFLAVFVTLFVWISG
ncbi:hypothetical protein [Celeribacter sp.]|uniref:hypothetical protein n=1 Tax=Celeribacter sp. TaxID=1890673 RepID=UPI003A928E12